ncbi:MAG: DUF58 domain-containing protein [Deltaproteobacteria bacterium]|nr:DUF58 domain-containing protein [Deltaproteobacteria bacterium]
MRLTLSAGGILAATLAILLLGFGLLAASPTLVFLATCAAAPLVVDAVLGAAGPARFREGNLRLGWGPAERAVRPVAGRPIAIDVAVRNPSPLRLPVDRADVFAGGRVAPDRRSLRLPPIPAGRELRHRIRIVPLAPGTLVLHGMLLWISTPLGLFRHRLYFPTPLRLKVLPAQLAARVPRPGRGRSEVRGPLPRIRAPNVAGDDADLRDIRDHRFGDPFRRIAWRPSARAGRLLTKEYERHLPRRHLVAVEASAATLRRVGGRAAFDALAAESYALMRAALRGGDAVGLCLFDDRVSQHVAPGGGRAAAAPLLDALLDAYQPIDADATDVTADELAQVVGRYLLLHERVDARIPGLRGAFFDRAAVVGAVARLGLSASAAARSVRGEDAGDVLLRRFCLDRGIEIPVQERYTAQARVAGIRDALALARRTGARAHEVHLFTDLDDLGAWNELRPELARLAAARVRLRCLFSPGLPYRDDPLHRVESLVRRERRLRTARWLRALGVQVRGEP